MATFDKDVAVWDWLAIDSVRNATVNHGPYLQSYGGVSPDTNPPFVFPRKCRLNEFRINPTSSFFWSDITNIIIRLYIGSTDVLDAHVAARGTGSGSNEVVNLAGIIVEEGNTLKVHITQQEGTQDSHNQQYQFQMWGSWLR